MCSSLSSTPLDFDFSVQVAEPGGGVLNGLKNVLAVDELSDDVVVSVQVLCLVEGDQEFRGVGIVSLVA